MSARPQIDRRSLVSRHDPHLTSRDDAILSVGNGSFAVGVDRTGTQTFPGGQAFSDRPAFSDGRGLAGSRATSRSHTTKGHPTEDRAALAAETRINTLAEWGWHTMPGEPPETWESLLRPYATPRGNASYMDLPGGTEDPGPGAAWFRENPHKVSLLRFALVDRASGEVPSAAEITDVAQHLELWSGTIRSRFRYRGRACTVTTSADPERAAIALELDAPGLELSLTFPYGTADWDRAASWDRPAAHMTRVEAERIRRQMDDLAYDVLVRGAATEQTGTHEVRLRRPEAHGAPRPTGPLDVVLELIPRDVPSLFVPAESVPAESGNENSSVADGVRERSSRFWAEHWECTGALDLSRTEDPRAHELERRAVLSRYIQRVHAAGTSPPAETGLLANSWRGKFHLEMHWWHAAHFALWGDASSLRRSLGFYTSALPVARETARRQGCRGARWPKQIGPDLRESPSDIGPFLLWQQPHPIHLAELLRRADPVAPSDPALAEVVEQSALCLVDLLRTDGDRLGLGGPLIGAQERHVADRAQLHDPAFELAYVAWALRIADSWRSRRGARDAGELTAIARLIHSPLSADGVLSTFREGPSMVRSDHPSHLLAYGMVPPTGTIPAASASAALDDAFEDWDWDST